MKLRNQFSCPLQNLIKTKQLGISEGVDYFTLSANQIKTKILKVLEDPSYALNAKNWSARYRDQKEKPLDRAIWWIEWLIRNPNCDHLKSPVHRLGFIAGNAYDIIVFVTLFIVFTIVAILKVCCCCSKTCAGKKGVRKHKKL